MDKPQCVYEVFQNISDSYDHANMMISLGLQKFWKAQLIKKIVRGTDQGARVLDVCCGTGDIAIAIGEKREDLRISGLDFSPAMLRQAKKKGRHLENVRWRRGDAMHLPYKDGTFGAASISFGLRNTGDYEQVIREMKRVVRDQGYVYCIDSFVPDLKIIRPFYDLYFHYIMPFLGGGTKHRDEYLWLWESTKKFVTKKQLLTLFEDTGLTACGYQSMMFGACVLVWGKNSKDI